MIRITPKQGELEQGEREHGEREQEAGAFEAFSAGVQWRALPLDIKLKVLELLTAERDTPEVTRQRH